MTTLASLHVIMIETPEPASCQCGHADNDRGFQPDEIGGMHLSRRDEAVTEAKLLLVSVWDVRT